MKITKRHLPHIVVLTMVVITSVVWSVFLLTPKRAEVKEIADPGYVPGAPQNAQAAAVSQNQIDISWAAPAVDEFAAQPTSYIVYRSLTGNDFASLNPVGNIPITPASLNQFSDTGLNPGTTYYYKVAAKNESGEGLNSNMASATTLVPSVPAPVLGAQALSSDAIRLTWNTDAGVSGYELFRAKDGDNSFSKIADLGTVNEFTDLGLVPATKYAYYVVAAMGAFKSGASNNAEATTLNASQPPIVLDTTAPVISRIQIVPDITTARITWQTDELSDSVVVYGETINYDTTRTDANKVLNHTINIDQLLPEKTYHFKVSSRDEAGNKGESADIAFTTLKKQSTLKDVSQVVLSTTTETINLNWVNPTRNESPDFAGVHIVRKAGSTPQNSNDGTLVYKGNDELLVDKTVLLDTQYVYRIFSYSLSGEMSSGVSVSGKISFLNKPVPEVCDKQNVDCTKTVCKKLAICQKKPPIKLPVAPPSTSTVSMLTLFDFSFLVKQEKLALTPLDDSISSLSSESMRIVFSKDKLPARPQGIVFRSGDGVNKEFVYDQARKIYYVDTKIPSKEGMYEAQLVVQHERKRMENINFFLHSVLPGIVIDENTQQPIEGVDVRLLDKTGRVVETDVYGQENPKRIAKNYGWMVPNGPYYVAASKNGYQPTTTSLVVVNNNIVNIPIALSDKKKPVLVGYVGVVDEAGNVKTLFKTVIAPVAAGLSFVTLLTQVSLFDLLALLRLLFLQPILLIATRKRESWGQVYNSLNKLPVDLAVVRLINQDKNQLVQSMVTGKSGKYYFKIGPGNYRVEVVKDKMRFPSEFLKSYGSDGRKTDLYHGEVLRIKDQYPIVNANIPGDPLVEAKTPGRLRLEKMARFLQFVISISGMGVTAYSLYLSPTVWYLWAILVLHMIIFVLFYRLAIPPKPKGWGVVYDVRSRRPLHRAIVRLFNTQFNKLVATQISDHHGRYFFLAGDSQYQMSFEKPEYEIAKSNIIDLNGKEEENIAVNVGMKRRN